MLGNFSHRRLLQAGRGRVRVGAVAGGLRLRPGADLDHRLRGRRRSSAWGPTRRPSRRGCPSASRASGSSRARGRRTSGRRARSARAARARSSTSTAASTSAPPDDLPGGENERFLEYWNLVFMQYNQDPENVLVPLPKQNIDTGLGLNRMALIQQGTQTIFETDQFLPLIRLGEELSGRTLRRGRGHRPRAAHPRRPHPRHVLPGRGRRRAVQRGPRLRAAPPDAPRGAPGPADRHRGPVPHALRGGRPRADGARLSRAARGGEDRRHVARARGGGVRADARAGHAPPRRAHRAGARARGGGHRRRGGLPAPRHLRLPVRPHGRARRPSRASAWTSRASRT